MRTMLITDCSLASDPSLLQKLEIACEIGIDAIQLREKNASALDIYNFAIKLRMITLEKGVALLINERVDIALAVKADGVHLPEHAAFPFCKHLKIGRSVHSLSSALKAETEGIDYLLFGPIFNPISKSITYAPQGLDKLQQVADSVQIPVIAVGGVTSASIPSLLQSGAFGVASVSSLLHAQDIAIAVNDFKKPVRKRKKRIQGLYAIVSSLPLARIAVEGGVDIIQFRHKGSYTQQQKAIVQEIRLLCQQTNILFLINDRSDIALEVDADGVHLGQTDVPVFVARQILGPNRIIGGSASTVEQALELETAGADYVGFGHIFPSPSKEKEYPPIGIDVIKKAKGKLIIPLIAIGGISEENASSVLARGADGLAVISAISRSDDPLKSIQRLKRIFYERSLCKTNEFA